MFSLYVNDAPVMHDAPREAERFETRHMATARQRAREWAATTGEAVEVCTHDRETGRRRIRTIIRPDGSAAPPPGMTAGREDCTRDSGRPCFCTPCRDERRKARA